jgi:hypothetical protein
MHGAASSVRGASRRWFLAIALIVLSSCAAFAGVAGAATAGGGHLPYFSLLDQKTAISQLPFGLESSFPSFPAPFAPAPVRGPVWFGEVERANSTFYAAGSRRQVCTFETTGTNGAGGGGCTTLKAQRELRGLEVSSCGKGRPRQFRISGLVPNGATGLEIEGADGTIGRTVPVLENTVAFEVGREDVTLRGVGDAAAERLETHLPLGHVGGRGDPRGGCSSYFFAEAEKDPGK